MLFRPSDFSFETAKLSGKRLLAAEKMRYLDIDSFTNLENVIGDLLPGEACEYFTKGDWSTHHLIAFMAEKVGPCDAYISSWALSDTAVRVLFALKDSGLFKSLHVVLDRNVKTKRPDAFTFLDSFSEKIKLTAVHAKVAALVGKDNGCAIVTSANLSVNKRFEAGLISFCKNSADFHSDWLMQVINSNDDGYTSDTEE